MVQINLITLGLLLLTGCGSICLAQVDESMTPTPTTPTPPAPYPNPIVGTWNSSCLMVKMAAQLNFTYKTKANKIATILYNIPADATVEDSYCGDETQILHVIWGPPEAIHSMLLDFEKVNEIVKLSMLRFVLPLLSDRFPDAKENQTIVLIHVGSDFEVPVNMSYHCSGFQAFNLIEYVDNNVINGAVTVHDVQVEAFRSNTTTGFSKASDCDNSTTNTTPTTTSSSTTTSTPKPTTPKPPTPSPDPIVNTWNSSCIMVQMAAQLNFTYVTKANETATTLYNVPSEAKVNNNQSICDGQTQSLYVTWGPMGVIHSMQLNFENVKKTVKLSMLRFVLPLVSDRFPDAKENQTIDLIHVGSDFDVPVNMSYHCSRFQTFYLSENVDNNIISGTVTVHDVQVEAFRSNTTIGFSKARDCDNPTPHRLAPWVGGLVLSVLVITAWIVYFLARRRSTSVSYMSF